MTVSGRFTGVKPSVVDGAQDPFQREEGYMSLRWKLLLPLFVILLVFAMLVTYFVTNGVAQGGQAAQTNQLLLAAEGATSAMGTLHQDQVNEATRLAYTQGVAELLAAGDNEALQRILEPGAAAAGLDSVFVFDASGVEVIGLHRDEEDGRVDYAVVIGTDLSNITFFLDALLQEERQSASALIMSEGFTLGTAVPVVQSDELVGLLIVGTRLDRVLETLRYSSLSQVVLYGDNGSPRQGTFEARGKLYESLVISPEMFAQTAQVLNEVPTGAFVIHEYAYQSAYRPFIVGQDMLGVIGIFLPDNLPYATNLSRQLLSLLMASLAGTIIIFAYVMVSRALLRVGQITATTQALARGEMTARTGMPAIDEVGELGRSLDVFADQVEQRQESLRTLLRRQRRENARLTAILQSIPHGVVVQDLDGRVLLMNEAARQMLGSQRVFRSSQFSELTAVVTDVLGPAIAPGIYALGQPQRIPLGEQMLSAQAAAILTISKKRVGTVILIQDITAQVRQEQAREDLLERLSLDAQEPLKQLVNVRAVAVAESVAPLKDFVREVTRNVAHLQRMIAEIRDLSDLRPEQVYDGQRPLSVEWVFDALAAEWRPVAEASGLSIQVTVFQQELYVLADERRLRWALGNLIDNAVKFTLPGGQVQLVAQRGKSGQVAELIVQDTGVGVGPDDLPHLFTRFYRGTPILPDRSVLRTPGMGQGLFIAKRVIEAHGGGIRLESRLGRGTRVVCALPLTSPVTMAVQEPGIASGVVPDMSSGPDVLVSRHSDGRPQS